MDPGSIQGITERLASWCVRRDRGLARVEWDSVFARQEVVDRLRFLLGAVGISLVEIAMPPDQTAQEAVGGLMEKLASASGAVSITGLEWAFPESGSRLETLAALSFRRETLAAFPVRQIWWMPSTLVERFVVGVPDLDSWFQLRLHLTEMPARSADMARHAEGMQRPAVSVTEARSVARRFWDRLEAARAQNVPEDRIWSELAQPAVDALLAAGLEPEADDILARTSDARGALERQLEELVASRGPEDSDVLLLTSRLARLLWEQGDFAGAQRLHERVLDVTTRVLGEEHPDALTAMGSLAKTLWARGDIARARQLQELLLEVVTRVWGEENPATLTAMGNLAVALWAQGDVVGARRLQERVLGVTARVLGEEHLDTLASMNNLAATLRVQGDLDGARRMEERVLEARTRVLGKEHPDTLGSMNNLALTLFAQGDLDGARRIEERVLEATTRVLGEEHPNTLRSMHNLAGLLLKSGDREDALRLLNECLIGRRRVLGENHPDTVATAELLRRIETQAQAGQPSA